MKSKSIIVQDGSKLRLANYFQAEQISVEPGVYRINMDEHGVFLTHDRFNYQTPKTLFQPVKSLAEFYVKILQKKSQTGLTLAADASYGVGKSMLAEVLANEVIRQGGVVINISVGLTVDYQMLSFVIRGLRNHGATNIMVYFDEFGRIYTKDRSSEHAHSREIRAQDMILPFFSDNDFKDVHKVITTNGNLSAPLVNRPQRIKYMLRAEKFQPTVDTYVAVFAKKGFTGEMLQYLIQACKMAGMTIDEALKIADDLEGVTDIEELTTQVSMLNVKPMCRNFHIFANCDFGPHVIFTTTINSEDLDERYRVVATTMCDDLSVETIFDVVIPYPMISSESEVNEVMIELKDHPMKSSTLKFHLKPVWVKVGSDKEFACDFNGFERMANNDPSHKPDNPNDQPRGWSGQLALDNRHTQPLYG